MRSLIVLLVSFVIVSCICPDSYESSEHSIILTCPRDDHEDNCCRATDNVCGREYSKRVGRYLDQEALSNGSCTGGGSGAYQCVHYAKDTFWHEALKFDNGLWSEPWQYAARGLMVARPTIGNGQNLFVFDNGSTEPPRETDLLIYQNINPNTGELYVPDNNHPGHVSVVSGVIKNDNGRITNLNLIEENLIISGNNGELCDQNLEDSVMRTVPVSWQNNQYTVTSGSSNLQVIGWIRHNLTGIFADEGWHEDNDDGVVDGHSISQAFRAVYQRWDNDFLGWSRDNGGTPFVHKRNGHILQDLVTSSGQGRALVYNPNLGTALLIRDGFYAIYLDKAGATGLPLDEEHPGVCLSVQNFENGYLCWSGWAVYWFSSGVLPPPSVEPEPESSSDNSGSDANPDSDTNESVPENQDQPPECYANDWLPCYTGFISTQNVGICQGGRVLCVRDHWQWDECVGEIIPSSEDCFDNMDNDCDSLTDCADPNCSGLSNCASDLGGSEEFQSSGENDCDGEIDDEGCSGRETDGPDADGDGYSPPDDCEDLDGEIDEGCGARC